MDAYLTIGQKINCCSDIITTNTVGLQGTVPASYIFTSFTADCRTHDLCYPLIKLADNTAMIGLIHSNYGKKYLHHLKSFVDYSNTNYLQLNISMTKELLIDFRGTVSPPHAVVINGVEIESGSSCKHV